MKEYLEFAQLTSVLINKACAFSYCANCTQMHLLFYTCAKTHEICLNKKFKSDVNQKRIEPMRLRETVMSKT